jgi:hypothetical protein
VRFFQRFRLGMRRAAPPMPAFAQRHAVADDHAADGRIRRGVGDRTRRELARPREVRRVARYGVTSTPCQKAT